MSRQCPSCESAIADDAVLCIQCGLDLRSGDHLVTDVSAASEAADTEPDREAVTEAETEPPEQRLRRGRNYTLAIIVFFLGGQVLFYAFMLTGNLVPSPNSIGATWRPRSVQPPSVRG